MNKLFLLSVLFLVSAPSPAQVVGPGYVNYVTSAPSGACSQGVPAQIVMGSGFIYTCQSGTWTVVGGGGSGITGTLTSGVIPRATGTNTLGNGTFLDTGTQVSIGTIGALSAYAQSTLPGYIGPAPLVLYTPSTAAATSFAAWNEAVGANAIYGASYGSNSDKYGVEGDAYTTGAVAGTGLYGYAQANAAGAHSITGVYGIATFTGAGTVAGPQTGYFGIASSIFADTVAVPLTGGALAAGLWVANQGSNFAIKTGTGAVSLGGALTAPLYNSTTNCAAAGSAANPSVAACSAASAGAFSCATNASTGTCTVNTTAVTANSQIFVQPDSSLGTRLSVTCNTTADTGLVAPRVSARSAATSFTITLGTFATNPVCFNYFIVN